MRRTEACDFRHLVQADLHAGPAAGRKRTALRRVQQVDRLAFNRHQLGVVHRIQTRDAVQQSLRVFMMGIREDLIGRAAFDNVAGVHDGDAVAHGGDDAQVMGDDDDGHAQLLLQIHHQFQDLRLNGDVQSRGRLVGDQQLRLAGQGDGDHDSLPHASGQLIGILLEPLLGLVDADQRQHFQCAPPCLVLVFRTV